MSTINVEDSTDWLSTTVPGLSRLETSLRCQVCRDFLTSPMITSCAHTFCSLCIRKSLSAEGKCPACREPESVSKLRRNWAVEESVAAWRAVREKVLAVARQEGKSEKGKKRDATEAEMEAELPRRTQRRKVVAIDSDDEEYRPEEERNDGLVPCPICSKRMKEADVFGHLDKCQAERQQRPPPKTAFNPPPSSQSTPTKRPQNLAHANFGLMKSEVHVRNQLKNAGIPAWGSRDVMMRRHVEWVNMFNANNDAEHPKPRGQLLRELDEWDKFQGGWAARVKKPKETDGQEYIRQHKEHYEELKAAALASMRKAVAKPVEEPKEGEPGQQQQNAPNQQQQNEPKPEASGPTGALPESTPAAGPVARADGHSPSRSSWKAPEW
ncbi:DNA repair protein rad18 [Trichodelitschia bisporula]|uniref:Postreplication repair E3 ubiquitin-protein ligase RAD18 n=1 Tax=Trichodelitschia bisporula TaxID=703511 RepID=A0A6G1HIC2_9PEZI|nr:DNA repair protein rad18 [Trichodelitschia bisporula]